MGGLDRVHPRKQDRRVGDEPPARLDPEFGLDPEVVDAVEEDRHDRSRVVFRCRGAVGLPAVGDAETAPDIDEREIDSDIDEVAGDLDQHLDLTGEGLDVKDLRADVAVDADRVDMFGSERVAVGVQDLPRRDAELACGQASRDLWVGGDVDGRVDPEGDIDGLPRLSGCRVELPEFVERVHRDPDALLDREGEV